MTNTWTLDRARSAPRFIFAFFVILLIGFAAPAAQAGPDTSAHKFMNLFGGKAVKVLADRSLTVDQRRSAVRRLLVDNFDVDAISRFVLARYWRTASEAQRHEFRTVFEDYIVAVYGHRLEGYSGEQFEVERTIDKGDGKAIVISRILRKDGPAVRVDWRIRQAGGAWRITDVVIEGVSMAITQRNEFSAVIRATGGVDGLLVKMREIIGKTDEPVGRMASNTL